jgi:hypothetical protein
MRTSQLLWSDGKWTAGAQEPKAPDLVLAFGGREVFQDGTALAALGHHVPLERVFGCSTAGEVAGTHVHDGTMVATALWFERGQVSAVRGRLDEVGGDSFELGKLLTSRLAGVAGLAHVFVLSDGLAVNGSALVRGLMLALPAGVSISGGLSGDGVAMQQTTVCHAGELTRGEVSVLAFSGPFKVGVGSLGGWDAFGPVRQVTKAKNNVLLELDGEPALALYKRYLGEHAAKLPSSGLLFPLLVRTGEDRPVVRTLLGVDEATGSMTFAGELPEGATAQLMRSNVERIVTGALGAATASASAGKAQLALVVSCVGRKLVLKQRVEEELEAVAEVLGADVAMTGFYSYGEIAPAELGAPCQLHNQTMTITTLSEA